MGNDDSEVSTAERDAKRCKRNADNIVKSLSSMPRKELEAVAKAALEASDEAIVAATTIIEASQKRLIHCKRCHTSFDPDYAGKNDCVVEGHDDSQYQRVRVPGGFDDFQYGCCGKMEDEGGPCWTGPHLVGDFDPKSDCWLDRSYDMQGWKGKTEAECFGCQYSGCEECCTCGSLRR